MADRFVHIINDRNHKTIDKDQIIIALTGGIGSGKSTALQAFAELGWRCLSADQICHDLYRDNQDLICRLQERWDEKIFSAKGVIDRKVIAGIIFNNPEELKWLNGILHPMIRAAAERQFAAEPEEDFVFEIPLLYECGWEQHYDAVICVWAEEEITKQRLLKRGLSSNEIELRMKNQLNPDRKLERADFALINNGSANDLYAQCAMLVKQLKETLWKKKI